MMPRLDGYQTCSLIKHNKMFRSTPVIMLSSKDGLFDRARGRMVGSEQYLTKPFTKEELLGAIERHVARRREPEMTRVLIVDDSPTEVHYLRLGARTQRIRNRSSGDGTGRSRKSEAVQARSDPDGYHHARPERLSGDA
jgi:CheY-like chemotaxis protein